MLVDFVLYRDKEDVQPQPVKRRSWSGFAQFLLEGVEASPCTLETCAGKQCIYKSHSKFPDGLMVWSPITIEGNRLNKNVRTVTMLVLDFDRLSEAAAFEVHARIQPYEFVLHTTHNHRAGSIQFRVVIPLTESVPANLWRRFRATAIQYLGVTVLDQDGEFQPDPSCKDLSRPYFFPSHPEDGPHGEEHHHGEPLDVATVLAWADANVPPEEPSTATSTAQAETGDWDLDGPHVKGAIATIVNNFPARRRHELALALGGMLRRAGATEEDAHHIVFEAFLQGGSDDPEMRAATVHHTYTLDMNSDALTGFTRVGEIVGEDVAIEFGEYIEDASTEAFLSGLTPRTSNNVVYPTPATAPVPPPLPFESIDLSELRSRIAAIASQLTRSQKRNDKIKAILIRRALKKEPLAFPGDVETRQEGKSEGVEPLEAVKIVMTAIGQGLPDTIPWTAIREILLPSLNLTAAK